MSNPFDRLSIEDRINFTRHLSIVIKAGLPLLEGLKIIRKQTVANKLLGKIIDQLIIDLNQGKFLADSLERYKNIFGDFYINIIRIGESSGTLTNNLLYLAEEIEKSRELRGKVRAALIYPIVILVATIGITALLTLFVFPKVLPIFTSLKIDLPFTTKLVIFIFHALSQYGWYILGVLILIPIGIRVSYFSSGMKHFYHRSLLHIPVVSSLTVNVNMANFTRVLAILLKSGVQIVEAMNVTSSTFSNIIYQDALKLAAEEVRRGEQFSHYLSAHPTEFPVLLAGMIEIGENTGNLHDNLEYLSEYYSKEVDTSLRNLTSLLEPLLILTMGLVVGFISLAIITPIYSLTQNLNPH